MKHFWCFQLLYSNIYNKKDKIFQRVWNQRLFWTLQGIDFFYLNKHKTILLLAFPSYCIFSSKYFDFWIVYLHLRCFWIKSFTISKLPSSAVDPGSRPNPGFGLGACVNKYLSEILCWYFYLMISHHGGLTAIYIIQPSLGRNLWLFC